MTNHIIMASRSVKSISDKFEDKHSDITSTTRIVLDEIDPRLRWGMTIVVPFDR